MSAPKSDRVRKALHDVPELTGEAFNNEVRTWNMDELDEYLSIVLVDHKKRKFVEEERQRKKEKLDAEFQQNMHEQSLAETRHANNLAKKAIWISILATLIAAISLLMQARGK